MTRKPHQREYWRSLSELADDPRLLEAINDEFDGYDPQEFTGVSRRSFVKLMAASMALAGISLTGCRRWPQQKIAPYTLRPAGREPNTRQQYATMLARSGIAHSLLVSTFEGRPIKVEGNPQHPIAQGRTDALAQASILELYDPFRSRGLEHQDERATWADFADWLKQRMQQRGRGVAVLCEANDSPALAAIRRKLDQDSPDLNWYTWDPLHRDNATAGSRAAFGKTLRPQYHLDKAKVIVSLDADLLGATDPAMLRHARDWAAGRRSADSDGQMNRLYVAESSLTLTGSVADERHPATLAQIIELTQAIKSTVDSNFEFRFSEFGLHLVGDMNIHHGESLVIAGESLPPQVHHLVWQINHALGAIGNTVTLTTEPDYELPYTQQIADLVSKINGNLVDTLIIIGGNPVYDAPADLDFAAALGKLKQSAHLSLYPNETSALCTWRLPRAHDFEAWGDGRSWDGVHCLRQPLIYPLFDGRSEIQLAAMLTGDAEPDGEKLVKEALTEDDAAWRSCVRAGFVEGSQAKAVDTGPRADAIVLPPSAKTEGFELHFAGDISVYDGRHAANAWMQETPDPLSKLTWDNAALLNIADARKLGIEQGDVLKISVGQASIEIAAYLMPGQAAGTITLPLGYGRKVAGEVGADVGFDVYPLRDTAGQAVAHGAKVENTHRRYKLAMTSEHYLIDGIGARATRQRLGEPHQSGLLLKETTLDEYRRDPHFAERGEHGDVHLQMFEAPSQFNDPHAWGMSIDLNACTGCGACVVACQSENNIPVVGKDQVLMHRQMQWLRIDRYFKTDEKDEHAENPEVVHMPMMCQQCENAPCEQVCPVGATTHDAEGLNVMVYNRCIGTRYCSNNCPYKVRRFNYFDFHSKPVRGLAKPWLGIPDQQQLVQVDQIKRLLFNPDVTVRMRGVMEKCTYCVQRIAAAKTEHRIEAVKAGDHKHRVLPEGAVQTACQQVCPTQAITFGNLNDPKAKVTQQHKTPRAYGVLAEMNTRPRTKYLALVRNPNI
ncbi:MAG: TAT-variant-translocated molybdopterin oxidoreductase [Phycisphaeraceae bacterium]|nr:TAT-variant-translocated molybdopterin oxidoreductase [Phycisphaeraceae bacterium]